MRPSDQMLARYAAQMEQKQTFIDNLVEKAEIENRDLTEPELEVFNRARVELEDLSKQAAPFQEAARLSAESRRQLSDLAQYMDNAPAKPAEVEYRSAGDYMLDVWRGRMGSDDAMSRLEVYNRAAAHQTTADNPGLIPAPILGPVINFIDQSRPLITALGARQLPGGSWSRPKITQHTQVGVQSGEKQELVSRKMVISSTPLTPVTIGGYLNISRQDLDFTQPGVLDIAISDLAGQYAISTEAKLGTDLVAGGTAADASTTIPTGAATAAGVSSAVWAAAGKVLTATAGQGRLVLAAAPDMLGVIGPIFPPVNPTNSQSTGFQASDFTTGSNASISGITVVVSAGLAAGTMLMISSAAAEVYEDRVGALQVVEPSVLGLQVAYAGYFVDIVLLATGIQKIVKTP